MKKFIYSLTSSHKGEVWDLRGHFSNLREVEKYLAEYKRSPEETGKLLFECCRSRFNPAAGDPFIEVSARMFEHIADGQFVVISGENI